MDHAEGQVALALLVELEQILNLELVINQRALVAQEHLVVLGLGLGVEVSGQSLKVRLLFGQRREVLLEVLAQELQRVALPRILEDALEQDGAELKTAEHRYVSAENDQQDLLFLVWQAVLEAKHDSLDADEATHSLISLRWWRSF